MDKLEECPLIGMLGRRSVGRRSNPKEELRLEVASKWPDRFSRNVAWSPKPESLREAGVVGMGGKEPEVGEDEVGEVPRVVEEVAGRPVREGAKALKTGWRGAKDDSLSPNEVEFKPAYFARDVEGALLSKREGFSDEKTL